MVSISTSVIQKIEIDMLREINQICNDNSIDFYLRAGSLLGAVRHEGPIPWDSDVDIEVPIKQYHILYELLNNKLSSKYSAFFYDSPKYSVLIIRVGIKGISHKSIHIDIFPMIGLSDEPKKNKKIIRKYKYSNIIFIIKRDTVSDILKKRKFMSPLLLLIKIFTSFISSNSIYTYLYNTQSNKSDIFNNEFVVNPFSKYGEKSIFPSEFYRSKVYLKFDFLELPAPIGYHEILIKLYGNYMLTPKDTETLKNKNYNIDITQENLDALLEKIIN